jgi:hypothetical protein
MSVPRGPASSSCGDASTSAPPWWLLLPMDGTESRPDHCANVIAFRKPWTVLLSWRFMVPESCRTNWIQGCLCAHGRIYGNVIASRLTMIAPQHLLLTCWQSTRNGRRFRPVDVEFDSCGRSVSFDDGTAETVSMKDQDYRIESTSLNFTSPDADPAGSCSDSGAIRAVSSSSSPVNFVLILGFRMLLFR